MRHSKELTKEFLIEAGFDVCLYDTTNHCWIIERDWFVNSSKIKQRRKFNITDKPQKRKFYSDDKYPVVQFSYNGKSYPITITRFIWAWLYNKVPAGYSVTLKDKNKEVDKYFIDNLQLESDKTASKYKTNRANQHYSKKRGINVKEAQND